MSTDTIGLSNHTPESFDEFLAATNTKPQSLYLVRDYINRYARSFDAVLHGSQMGIAYLKLKGWNSLNSENYTEFIADMKKMERLI